MWKEPSMALRDSMRSSATQFLQPGEQIQAVVGAQTASEWLAAITGVFVIPSLNRSLNIAGTHNRIVVLDAGKASMKTARGVVRKVPRSTRLGPATDISHKVPVTDETLRVH